MPTTAIETAVDALLQVIVTGNLNRRAAAPLDRIKATPFEWRDPSTIPLRSAPDLSGLIADPIGTACRAELVRLGHGIHVVGGLDALDEAIFRIAEMDPAHSDWRAIVLETAWGEIGRKAA